MIATASLEHPSDQELVDFGFGRVPADRFEQLLGHIEACDRCQNQINSPASDDSFGAILSRSNVPEPDPVVAEPDCQAAIFHAAGSPVMRLDSVMPPIETLGPYRLIRPLGRGGMGAVYLAQHQRLKKTCAIKLLPRGRGFDSVWVNRFERETQAVAALSHPGIVTATDAGDQQGWHYLVMEYLDGLDLSAIIRRIGPIDIAPACAIMRDVCSALSAVHDAGLVHRDIKPSNIMLTCGGDVKLLDLGLVLDQSKPIADMRLTTVGHVIGTLAFAAPEQLTDSEAVDGRADLYGVGATLFQLISGQTAHDWQRGIAPLVLEKSTRPAKPIREIRADVPVELADLVADLLQRDPNQRPNSASEVADRLQTFAPTSSLKSIINKAIGAADPDPMLTQSLPSLAPSLSSDPPRQRHWLRWLAAGAGAAAILATVIITIESGRSTVRIETEDSSVNVQVAELDSNLLTAPEKLFKGKPLSYWTELLVIERDVDTLGDAINAVVSLADADDVDAAEAILVSARRFGGWSSSGDTSDPSQWYMTQFNANVGRIMPDPGIAAITRELSNGNEQSRSACLWSITRFKYGEWAANPENRDTALKLHQTLCSIVSSDQLSDMSLQYAKEISLKIAISTNLPLEDEPGLREDIRDGIAKSREFRILKDRLNEPWLDEFADFPNTNVISLDQFVAAHRLGITLPTILEARMSLDFDSHDQVQRNDWFVRNLEQDPEAFADEAVLFLHTAVGPGWEYAKPDPATTIHQNESLWIETLPTIAAQTTRPDILIKELHSVIRSQPYLERIRAGIDDEMTKVIVSTLEKLEPRVQALFRETPSLDPTSDTFTNPTKPAPGGGGMF
ncbi:serine/threonine protein kinase [Rubripirellula reticaptiva]|uniref:Serine/threonine-protein kinase StkP n=1 Tax=Rubripirellula reticaptiva TaxID=2528013 RepID=A0A5C6FBR3_9BACT|nr:serine/threonine-protein kinase [Rubripirellula reticaptiva]TWU57724.1 Serine/threonine-protein kinase StkP [Rubripirellula reticaptiva]